MRKFLLISILLVFTATITGCDFIPKNNTARIEMIAFGGLTDEEKALIPVSPKDAIVEKIKVNEENKSFIDKNYNKDEVYAVIFNRTETDTTGKLAVFIDLDRETIVGKGFLKSNP